jgi:oligopeptide/dipeptide ABC transporter ATP-binding protein
VTGESSALLRAEALRRHFPVRNAFGIATGVIRALDDVSFEIREGETLGVVGESGCGKSTLGKTLAGIHAADAGRITLEGADITALDRPERRRIAQRMQYIHQDPGNALDPRWTIGRSLDEPLAIHTTLPKAERQARVRSILASVGLPETHLDLYPHEISGGQQRRVGLARILTLQPRLVILDEPTSGLDVSVQATVLKLLRALQAEFRLTYLFISHDLSVVRVMCDRIAVMYLGRIVEIGPAAGVFAAPRHPYTRSLLSAIPQIGGRRVTDTFALEGEAADASRLPSGCRFRGRCLMAQAVCAEREPALARVGAQQEAACHFADVEHPSHGPASDHLAGDVARHAGPVARGRA